MTKINWIGEFEFVSLIGFYVELAPKRSIRRRNWIGERTLRSVNIIISIIEGRN